MTVGVRTFRGGRLTEARLARGLSKKSLGDMIGVSGTAISRYEDGNDSPKEANFLALAERLNFPTKFFLADEWSERIETVFWRSHASESKYAREMTEQRMRWLCEIFEFLQNEVTFPALQLPSVDVPSDFRMLSCGQIEAIADAVRSHWKLGARPIPDMTLALENAGIPVVNLEIVSEKQDGFYFRSEELNQPFVGINVLNVSSARARFDAAHELGHILLHRRVTPSQSRDPANHKALEQQAHRFAGALLFPRSAFFEEVGIPSLDYFSGLKKRWGISIGAMIFRACDLGIIDDAEKGALYHNMARRRWRGPLREPFDDPRDMPLEKPRMLRRGVEAILNAHIFGRSSLLEALPHPATEIEQLTGLSPGFLSNADIGEFQVSLKLDKPRAVDLESGNVLEFPKRRNR